MAAKLFLRPQFLPLFTLFPKFPIFSLSPLTSFTKIRAQIQVPDPELSYGPSLRKGTIPTVPKPQSPLRTFNKPSHQEEDDDDDYLLDEEIFTRVFEIVAIRIPSKDCFALESRLRGHLLNWPRIRNIARVPGDDVDDELVEFIGDRNDVVEGEEAMVSLSRRIYGNAEGDGEPLSPVLYREKLVKTFDSRGFVKFRNLARMTRPKKKKKKKMEEEGGEERRKKGKVGKNGFAVVEVIEDEWRDGQDLKGLLGDEFHGKKWRGPTRLLLLDERYSKKCAEELPEAIKVYVTTLCCS